MCSLNDNDLDDDAPEPEYSENTGILDEIQCQKCNDNKATIKLRGRDVYCNSCFQINVTHKFRATLGKSKIVRPNDKVLVAHSGSCQSTALLNLIKAGMHESVHKRLMFQTQVIHVEDGMIKQQSIDERQLMIEDMKQQVETLGFETFVVSLTESLDEDSFEKIDTIQHYLCSSNNSSDEQLIGIFKNLTNDTSREDLIKKLRTRVIIKAAKLLGCRKIFFADDSTSLSICILTNVSLGRGAQLSLDVGFVDNRYGDDLLIMRPLRDFSRHEVNHYLNIHNLKVIDSKRSLAAANIYGSIRQLTEHFVTDLDSQFNGTVSTIFRVSEKVGAVAANTVVDVEICILCNAPLDTSDSSDTISAIGATAFSRFVSSDSTTNSTDDVDNCGDRINGCSVQDSHIDSCCGSCVGNDRPNKKQNNVSVEDISSYLCYGCRLIFHNNYNHRSLPKFLINAANEQLCLRTMRKQITNFLL